MRKACAGSKWLDRGNRLAWAGAGTSEREIRDFLHARAYRCGVIHIAGVDMGVANDGARFCRYRAPDEPAAPDTEYVFNLMLVRDGFGRHPDPWL